MTRSDDYQPDRFDSFKTTNRVGVHRAKTKLGSAKVTVLFAFLATLILTTLGVIFVQLQPDSIKYSEEQPETPVKVITKPELNPEAQVVILNGTEIDDLAYFVDDQITENSWGIVAYSGDAEKNDIALSAVFYGSEDQAAAAMALAEKLGGMSAYLNADYMTLGGDLTVLLGLDYRGPGYEESLTGEHPRSAEALNLESGYDPSNEFFDGGYDGEYIDGVYYENGYLPEEYYEEEVWQ